MFFGRIEITWSNLGFSRTKPLFPDADPEPQDTSQPLNQQYGCGQQARLKKGHYKAMNKGLVAAITAIVEDPPEEDDVEDQPPIHDPVESEDIDNDYKLLPNIALMGYTHLDLKMLDKALCGPNAKEWEEALKYKINQFEKLGTWIMQDLPPGQSAIPCSKVVWVKHSPDSEVQSYRVRIIARGHRQVEGVNYTKTFSAATKMPTVRIILTNTAHQDWEIEHINIKSAYLNALLKEVIYSEQQNHSSVGHFHKDCFVVLEILGLNLWNLKDMYFDILSFNLKKSCDLDKNWADSSQYKMTAHLNGFVAACFEP